MTCKIHDIHKGHDIVDGQMQNKVDMLKVGKSAFEAVVILKDI